MGWDDSCIHSHYEWEGSYFAISMHKIPPLFYEGYLIDAFKYTRKFLGVLLSCKLILGLMTEYSHPTQAGQCNARTRCTKTRHKGQKYSLYVLGKNLPIGLRRIDIRVSLGPSALCKALDTAKFVTCNIYVIINEKLITNLDDENLLVTIYGFYGAQTTTCRRPSPLRSSPILGPPYLGLY